MNDECRKDRKSVELAAEVVQYVVLRWGRQHPDVVGDVDFYQAMAAAAEAIYGDQATVEQLEKDHQAMEALRTHQIDSLSWKDEDHRATPGCWQAWPYGHHYCNTGRGSASADPADAIRRAVELQGEMKSDEL